MTGVVVNRGEVCEWQMKPLVTYARLVTQHFSFIVTDEWNGMKYYK